MTVVVIRRLPSGRVATLDGVAKDAGFGADDLVGGRQAKVTKTVVHRRSQFELPLAVQDDFLHCPLWTQRRIGMLPAGCKRNDLGFVVFQRQLHLRAGHCLAQHT